MAKIVLINPCPKYVKGLNKATTTPPLGLAYLAAVLEKHNHKIQIVDANALGIKSEIINSSLIFKPDLIGIYANIANYRAAIEAADRLKSLYPDTPIILGGPHSSSLGGSILERNSAVDAVAIGEGENTLLEVAESLGVKSLFENIKGLAWRGEGQIIYNEARPLIENLDDIPFPAYHLLPDLKDYSTRTRAQPAGYIITSRGCPFQCTFCNRNIFGKVWRPHSVNRVMDEIEYMVSRYRIKQIDIFDDNFTFDAKRTTEILDRLAKMGSKLYINLQNGVRVDNMDEELLRKMKKAGVFKISFAIEAADEDIQKRIKKNIDLDKAALLTRIARSLGIVTTGFFMLGLPGDNAKTMRRNIDFALKMNPHHANFMLCIPFPGTEIFEEVKKRGEFLADVENGVAAGFFGHKVFFKLDSMDPQEILRYVRLAYKRFYLRPSKIIDVLLTIKSIGELKWLIDVLKENNILKWLKN